MMPYVGTLIPFAIEITRASPLRMPIRNLAMSRGDDVTLALTIFDTAGTPFDLSHCVLTATVLHAGTSPIGYGWGAHCDYGMAWFTEPHRVLWQAAATWIDPFLGTAQVTMPREVTGCWSGRYEMLLALDGTGGGAIIARGSLDVRGGIVMPRPVILPSAELLSGIGTFDPPLGGPGGGLFDNVALLPTAALGTGVLGQFRLG